MKTTKQIADDCGIPGRDVKQLEDILSEKWVGETPYAGVACEIIGALYRRIEKLECGLAEVRVLATPIRAVPWKSAAPANMIRTLERIEIAAKEGS